MLIVLQMILIPLTLVSIIFVAKPFKINREENTLRIGYPIHFKKYNLQTYTFYVYVANLAPLALRKRLVPAWKLVVFALPQNTNTVFIKNIHTISGKTNCKNSAEKEKDKFVSLLQNFNADFKVDTAANHIVVKNDSDSKIYETKSINFFTSILK